MTDQYSLPFPDLPIAGPCPALWISAARSTSPTDLARLLSSSFGAIFDGLTARQVVDKGDIILFHGTETGKFAVFAFGVATGIEERYLRCLDAAIAGPSPTLSNDSGVRELIAIGFSGGGLEMALSDDATTGLERALYTLRDRDARRYPPALLSTCSLLDARFPSDAPLQLRAIVAREQADAMQSSRNTDIFARSEINSAYTRAAELFERAGGLSTARSIRDRMLTDQTQQLAFPFKSPRSNELRALSYRIEKLFGRRIELSARLPEKNSSGAHARRWRCIGEVTIPEKRICEWLSGAGSRTIKPSATISKLDSRIPNGAFDWVLEAGFDSELSVLLDVPGKTGAKSGSYGVSVRSKTCVISPARRENAIGRLSEFLVQPEGFGHHSISVELTTAQEKSTLLEVVLGD